MITPANLLRDLPTAGATEDFAELLRRPGLHVERIVSHGHATPPDQLYDQPHDEWVLLLAGAARLWLEGEGERMLGPGDHLLIPAHQRHRVIWTTPDAPTVWLVLHLGES